MRKSLMLLIISIVMFACSEDTIVVPTPSSSSSSSYSSISSSSSSTTILPAQLTISNRISISVIDRVFWDNGAGRRYQFGNEWVLDSSLSNEFIWGITYEGSSTKTVNAGAGYIYFYINSTNIEYITINPVTVTNGEYKTFVLRHTNIIKYQLGD